MRGIICHAATPRYFEGARVSRALLDIFVSGHGYRLNTAIVTISMVWMM